MTADSMTVKFWGVRGSIAVPGASTVRYGGNTSCIEVRCGQNLVILDAGTGLRELGRVLKTALPIHADIFLSHCHADHVCGLPFFAPAYSAASSLRLWAGNLGPDIKLSEVVDLMMTPPLFPIGPNAFQAKVEFRDFRAGEVLHPVDGLMVRTIRLNHPHGATGFRIEFAGRALAYVTDHQIGDPAIDEPLRSFLQNVDLLICDSTYTDEELGPHVNWGHSSWQQGLALAREARAKQFCLFHHHPDHDDAMLDRIAEQADAMLAGTIVAREDMHISL
ncbi:MAG TPA: MBL fold metallo-hydrolase [Xanthobacteraceae bacterium]|jgi:phosphoribosyl 1,2-cyclic phosphodiesterase|nr:MBL fold metallo-hydrolase [Xanthobacteraceae bacterium]